MEKGWLEWFTFILVFLGGVNWIFFSVGYDLVDLLIKTGPLAQTIYAVIALATFYVLYLLIKEYFE